MRMMPLSLLVFLCFSPPDGFMVLSFPVWCVSLICSMAQNAWYRARSPSIRPLCLEGPITAHWRGHIERDHQIDRTLKTRERGGNKVGSTWNWPDQKAGTRRE